MVGRMKAKYNIHRHPILGCGTLIMVTSRPVKLLDLLYVSIMEKYWNIMSTFRMVPLAMLLIRLDTHLHLMAESHVGKAWASLSHNLPFLGNKVKASSEGRVCQNELKDIKFVLGEEV